MSEDLLRTARQLLAELDACEMILRSAAIESLPVPKILSVERRAGRKCAELLASLGSSSFEVLRVDDATDELLTGVVRATRPEAAVRQSTATQVLAAPESVSRYEPFDDGPEGAADDGNDMRSEEEAERAGLVPLEDPEPTLQDEQVEDEDTAETPLPQQIDVSEAPSGSLVSFDDPSDSTPSYLSYDDAVAAQDEASSRPRSVADSDPFGSLVSFEEAPPDSEEESATTIQDSQSPRGRGRTPPPAPARFSDVGADALVTMDQGSSDLLGAALAVDDDLEEIDLEPDSGAAANSSETFDLMPDLADEDMSSFEDEEVTMVKTAETPDWDKPKAAAKKTPAPARARTPAPAPSRTPAPSPSRDAAASARTAKAAAAPAGRVTAGLYGGGSVPTIRDSDEPRPRAAAIQLNSSGGGKVIGLEEEEEPIEIGAAEDYDGDYDEADLGGDGFSITLQAQDDDLELDDDDEEDDEEEEEDDEVIEPAAAPEPVGPTVEEVREMLGKAQAAAASGDLQRGADLFSDVIDADPDNVDAHVSRGRLYLDLGDYSRAMSDFMVAEDLSPQNPEPQVAIGDLYFARKDYRKAIDYFNAALELAPSHAMAFCRRGISHYYRKNYAEAVTDLLKAEKLEPDIPNIQTYVTMAKKKVRK